MRAGGGGGGGHAAQQILGPLLVTLVSLGVACFQASVHNIEEGHRGVYWRTGRLTPDISLPGVSYMVPFITEYRQVSEWIL